MTVEKYCRSNSAAEYEDLSCGGVGDTKKVRYIPAENREKTAYPEWIEVSDSGDFKGGMQAISFVFMGAMLVIGIIMMLIGTVISKAKANV